jgi:hypothetical protein
VDGDGRVQDAWMDALNEAIFGWESAAQGNFDDE